MGFLEDAIKKYQDYVSGYSPTGVPQPQPVPDQAPPQQGVVPLETFTGEPEPSPEMGGLVDELQQLEQDPVQNTIDTMPLKSPEEEARDRELVDIISGLEGGFDPEKAFVDQKDKPKGTILGEGEAVEDKDLRKQVGMDLEEVVKKEKPKRKPRHKKGVYPEPKITKYDEPEDVDIDDVDPDRDIPTPETADEMAEAIESGVYRRPAGKLDEMIQKRFEHAMAVPEGDMAFIAQLLSTDSQVNIERIKEEANEEAMKIEDRLHRRRQEDRLRAKDEADADLAPYKAKIAHLENMRRLDARILQATVKEVGAKKAIGEMGFRQKIYSTQRKLEAEKEVSRLARLGGAAKQKQHEAEMAQKRYEIYRLKHSDENSEYLGKATPKKLAAFTDATHDLISFRKFRDRSGKWITDNMKSLKAGRAKWGFMDNTVRKVKDWALKTLGKEKFDWADLRRDRQEELNKYIKAITGAQMSYPEFKRLEDAYVNFYTNPEVFMKTIDDILLRQERKLKSRYDSIREDKSWGSPEKGNRAWSIYNEWFNAIPADHLKNDPQEEYYMKNYSIGGSKKALSKEERVKRLLQKRK